MNIIGQQKPSLEDLAHYGVKGMRWGHRKAADKAAGKAPLTVAGGTANRTPTKGEILTARKTLRSRVETYNALNKKYGKTPGTRYYEYTKEHDDVVQKIIDSDETVVALYKTRGEQVASAILLGPAGLVLARNSKGRLRSRLENKSFF